MKWPIFIPLLLTGCLDREVNGPGEDLAQDGGGIEIDLSMIEDMGSDQERDMESIIADMSPQDMNSSNDLNVIPTDADLEESDYSDLMVATDLDVVASDMDSDELDLSVMDLSIVDMASLPTDLGIEPIVQCFPEETNANLSATLFAPGPMVTGSELCDLSNATDLDNSGAELGFSGGEDLVIADQAVSTCLVADFGRQCLLNPHVGVAISVQPIAEACSEEVGQPVGQCDVEDLCGTRPGASALIFVASQLDDPRFVSRVGGCGEGNFFTTLTPVNSFADVADLENVRYVFVCRPSYPCGPDQADLSVDAVYLTWR